MQIAANKAVSIDYTLTNDAGEVIDSSAGGAPLVYLHGSGNIIAGLEKALEGKQGGDVLNYSQMLSHPLRSLELCAMTLAIIETHAVADITISLGHRHHGR